MPARRGFFGLDERWQPMGALTAIGVPSAEKCSASPLRTIPAFRKNYRFQLSLMDSMTTLVEVPATNGRLEIFSPNTIRYLEMSLVRILRR